MSVDVRAAAGSPSEEAPVRLLGRTFEYKFIVAAVFVSALFLDILDGGVDPSQRLVW